MGAPPIWTTVPAEDGSSGWEVYNPEVPATAPPHTAAPAPTVTAADPAQTIVEHHVTHRARVPDHHRRQPAHRETVVKAEPTGAVLATATATQASYDSILLLTALCVAIACFAVGATPTDLIRWRRGAIFVAYRRKSVTVAGGLFLLAAAILLATH